MLNMQVIVDNLAITYDLEGTGKLVLLLHGWGDDHRTFSKLAAQLRSRYQVLTLDLPGFGSSQVPAQPWNLDDYANLVASFLTKLNLAMPEVIIGHSNGGALAIRALSLGKLKTQKLVLLASSGIRNTHLTRRFLTKIVAKTGKIVTVWLPLAKRQQLRKKLYGTIGSDLLVALALQQTFKLTVRQDVQVDAAKIKLPVLLIFADQDPAIPESDGKRYHELMTNSKLEIISGNDHFIHQQQSETVNHLIEAFLR